MEHLLLIEHLHKYQVFLFNYDLFTFLSDKNVDIFMIQM